jgi:hypothetical protein
MNFAKIFYNYFPIFLDVAATAKSQGCQVLCGAKLSGWKIAKWGA